MRINCRHAILATAAAGVSSVAVAQDDRRKDDWRQGVLRHVLSAASHEAILLKFSFVRPLKAKVRAQAGCLSATGTPTDADGRYWAFWLKGLEPDSVHQICLTEGGRDLGDPWPIKKLPQPEQDPERFRVLAYTCAGGLAGERGPKGVESLRSLAVRLRLLANGLRFAPDAVTAIGDHV